MTMLLTEQLRQEYGDWLNLPANANAAEIGESADDTASELMSQCDALGFDNPPDRPEPMKSQIDWLLDFQGRFNCAQRAEDICRKWLSKIGVGFHPDTHGDDYSPALSPADVADYDNDIGTLGYDCGQVCPYAVTVAVAEDMGLI